MELINSPADDGYAHQYLDPDSDPTRRETARLQHQLAQLRTAMPPKQRHAVELYARGHTKKEIIEKLHTSNQTINLAVESTKGLKMLRLHAQLAELRNGPSMNMRRDMAWRIAKNNEHNSPNTALRAVDLLNRQSGDYQSEQDRNAAEGLTVNIQNFQMVVNKDPSDPNPEKDITPNKHPQFQPITVNIDDN